MSRTPKYTYSKMRSGVRGKSFVSCCMQHFSQQRKEQFQTRWFSICTYEFSDVTIFKHGNHKLPLIAVLNIRFH